MPLTPSEFYYLLGSTLMPHAEITDPELKAASAQFKFGDQRKFVEICTAGALIALHNEGSAKLEYTKKKKLGLVTVHQVTVTRIADTTFPADSLERPHAANKGK